MPIKAEHVELEHLPGSPLALALAQVRFLPLPAIDSPTHIMDFQNAVSADYELLAQQVVQQFMISIGPAAAQAPNVSAPGNVWQFASRDERWKLALSQTSIAIETDAYTTFDEFRAELERVLTVVNEHFAIGRTTRLGLRYVNEIADERLLESGGLLYFFTPEFLPAGGELSDSVAASYSEVRFDQEDGSLVIRNGLVQPGKYLLDFDYYNETEGDFNVQKLVETVSNYHDVIDSVFARAITEDYMNELKKDASAS